jgi:hypothetical protein
VKTGKREGGRPTQVFRLVVVMQDEQNRGLAFVNVLDEPRRLRRRSPLNGRNPVGCRPPSSRRRRTRPAAKLRQHHRRMPNDEGSANASQRVLDPESALPVIIYTAVSRMAHRMSGGLE